MPDAALEVCQLSKEYSAAGGPVRVLADVDLTLRGGDAMAVMGPSGSGKSTLLHIIGALEPPTAGTVELDRVNPFALPEKRQAAFRNEKIGFVFQDHCLLPQCSVLENVLVPTLVAPPGDYKARALDLLQRVGLSHRLDHLPAALSGGEKQRVAVARALIRNPLVLLCDEPTGNLDRAAADTVVSLILDLARSRGAILVMVTHSAEVAARMPLVCRLADGRLERCEVPHTRLP